MKMSNCCGVRGDYFVYSDNGDPDGPTWEEVDKCPKCKEHCEFYSEEDFCEECGEFKDECTCIKESEESKAIREDAEKIYNNYKGTVWVQPGKQYSDYYGKQTEDDLPEDLFTSK